MKRLMYRARVKQDALESTHVLSEAQQTEVHAYISSNRLLTASLFLYGQELFFYYECLEEDIPPDQILCGLDTVLEKWPGESGYRFWVPMADIFHNNQPHSDEHWQRKSPVEIHLGRVARLKPEFISRYIFYHYQRQEEQPGNGSKYGIIGIHENLLFFYQENPPVIEPALHKGTLDTSNTPANWHELMYQHFIPWEDVDEKQRYWRRCETLLRI